MNRAQIRGLLRFSAFVFTASCTSACSSHGVSTQAALAAPLRVDAENLWKAYQASLKSTSYRQQLTVLANTHWHDYFEQVNGTLSDEAIVVNGHVFRNIASAFAKAEAQFTALEAVYPTIGDLWRANGYDPLRITQVANQQNLDHLANAFNASTSLGLVDQGNEGLTDPAQIIAGGYALPTTNPQTGKPYNFCGGGVASSFNQAVDQWSWNAASAESCVVTHTGALTAAETAKTVGKSTHPSGIPSCNTTTQINANVDAGSHGAGTYGWVEDGAPHSGKGHSCYNDN